MQEEEEEPIDIEFAEQNAGPENDENAIDFRWSDVQEEDGKTLLRRTSLRAYKTTDEEYFKKKQLEDCLMVAV